MSLQIGGKDNQGKEGKHQGKHQRNVVVGFYILVLEI